MAAISEVNWEEQLQTAVKILREGGLVAYPTDTVYGLGADAFNERAVERVYEVKGRPEGMPLPLLLADVSQISQVAVDISDLAWRLAERFLPGALTLVLHSDPRIPRRVTAGGDTIAVRVPDHPVPRALIHSLGSPITGTSANLSGMPSITSADEVARQLGAKVDLIISYGGCYKGKESTIVDTTGSRPRILRQGAIPRDEIEKACSFTLV